MKKNGWGKIVNFTSVTLNGAIDGHVPYIASKGAIYGLTKSVARELGPCVICLKAIALGLRSGYSGIKPQNIVIGF